MSVLFQRATDIINGEILFAQGDHFIAQGIGFGRSSGPLLGWEKELAVGLLAKLGAKNTEAAGGVAEALSDVFGRKSFHEIRAESLVLSLSGVLGFQENPSEVCYVFYFTVRHTSTISRLFLDFKRIIEFFFIFLI